MDRVEQGAAVNLPLPAARSTLNRVRVVAGSGLYLALLLWTYPNVIVPIYSPFGMTENHLSTETYFVMSILAMIPAFWLSVDIEKPSEMQWWILYLFVYVPSCILCYHVTDMAVVDVSVFLTVVLVSFAMMCAITTFLRPLSLPLLPLDSAVLYCGIIAFTVVTYGALFYYTGYSFTLPSLEELAGLRADLKLEMQNFPKLLAYAWFWQGTLVNPFIMAAGFASRRPAVVVVGAALEVLLFAITSLRVFLLLVGWIVGVAFLMRGKRRRQLGIFMLFMVLGVTVLSVTAEFVSPFTFYVPLLFLQRFVFLQGELSGHYLEFFTNHSPVALGHSILSFIVPYRYDMPPGELIGAEYMGGWGDIPNATGNLWADAFSNFGLVGIVAFSAIAGVLMWIADSAWRGTNRTVAIVTASSIALSFLGQGVLTSILTGALLPFTLLGLALPHSTAEGPPLPPSLPRGGRELPEEPERAEI